MNQHITVVQAPSASYLNVLSMLKQPKTFFFTKAYFPKLNHILVQALKANEDEIYCQVKAKQSKVQNTKLSQSDKLWLMHHGTEAKQTLCAYVCDRAAFGKMKKILDALRLKCIAKSTVIIHQY